MGEINVKFSLRNPSKSDINRFIDKINSIVAGNSTNPLHFKPQSSAIDVVEVHTAPVFIKIIYTQNKF
jgi:hypothetical protein